MLEPLFVKYNVSVVFTGHDHFYERIKPQKGIAHFVIGSAGKLSPGDIDRRSGRVIDSGIIVRRKEAAGTGTPGGK